MPKVIRTKKQVDEMIAAITDEKDRLPDYNAFGESNAENRGEMEEHLTELAHWCEKGSVKDSTTEVGHWLVGSPYTNLDDYL